ncbi:MAG: ATP-grasp domain-containing protein [Bdellovibrionales bacterium]|nr:ATP-grasp domain-containing protein [Bdellovibrionales bacterium]
MKRLRVLVLVHEDLVPPEKVPVGQDLDDVSWKTEYNVREGLVEAGHEVSLLGVRDDTHVIRQTIQSFSPHIIFNLLEEFAGQATFDQHVVSYLEMLGVSYTGCNPRGLIIARSKDLAKKLMRFHRIPTPDFLVFSKSGPHHLPKKLQYPLFVKSLTEEASMGITQDSVVWNEANLRERISYFSEKVDSDVIVESYIDGREFYVGVIGNKRLQVFPLWELTFKNTSERVPKVATRRVKWDSRYRKKFGIDTGLAQDLNQSLLIRMQKVAKRTYSALGLSGYARIDMRMDAEGNIYVIEANPNPDIGNGEDFAASAVAYGLSYTILIDKILSLGLTWKPVGT